MDETGSTNEDLIGLAAGGEVEGLWYRAIRQTGGKGRQGRSWVSATGNLYASTLVRLRSGDPNPASLALTAAVALIEIVSLYAGDKSVLLKWPNDILADGAKLSGILLERTGDAVVVGFGVNIAEAPAVSDRATVSIAQIAGAAPDAGIFLEDLAQSFERWLESWRSSPPSVRARWMNYAHPVGTPLAVHESEGRVTNGLFQGIDDDGSLRLRLADGSEHVIHAGDVFLI